MKEQIVSGNVLFSPDPSQVMRILMPEHSRSDNAQSVMNFCESWLSEEEQKKLFEMLGDKFCKWEKI